VQKLLEETLYTRSNSPKQSVHPKSSMGTHNLTHSASHAAACFWNHRVPKLFMKYCKCFKAASHSVKKKKKDHFENKTLANLWMQKPKFLYMM